MKPDTDSIPSKILEKERNIPFIWENRKIIIQFIFTFLFIALGIWFVKHEKAEISEVKNVLNSAHASWVALGIAITVFYVLLMGLMYVFAFKSIGCKVRLADTMVLFLKRNLVSVFLPAGGVSSLAFFTGNIESRGVTKTQVHFASSIYGFVSIFSVVIVSIPVFLYAVTQGASSKSEWYALLAIVLLLGFMIAIYYSVKNKGLIYRWLIKAAPSLEVFLDDLQNHTIQMKHFYVTLLLSVMVEIVGIVHVYISMMALGLPPSIFASVMGYLIAVIFLLVSPFLRGLGAIEFSMSLVFSNFGFSSIQAIAITFLFRFFEFWLPILAGIVSFFNKANKFLSRLIPAILLFAMGIINILSFVTPAIKDRLDWLERIVILDVINASNYFVFVAGLFLLVTAAFLLRGLRSAWWFAIVLLTISFIGHLTRNVDYEDATIALIILVILFFTRKQYYIKTNSHFRDIGFQTALYSIIAVFIYATIGFYSFDKRYFGTDFTLMQSIKYSFENYFLLGSPDLNTVEAFARHFLLSIRICGVLTFSFLVYLLVRPLVSHKYSLQEDLDKARELAGLYGKSVIDYFKTLNDKIIFFTDKADAFVSFRMASNFAVVLENPVAKDEPSAKSTIKQFEKFCYENSLKSVYYKVPEEDVEFYKGMGKKSMCIGQTALVELNNFDIEYAEFNELKEIYNSICGKGYSVKKIEPKINEKTIFELEHISNKWQNEQLETEITFTHGDFSKREIKSQTILVAHNTTGNATGFLTVIPVFSDGIPSFDLLRNVGPEWNEIKIFLLIEFLKYCKEKGYKYANIGFAPMSGLASPQNFPERSIKFAFGKISSLSHFKGIRETLEKFKPQWKNHYLVYDHDYDLLQVPSVLVKIFKPVWPGVLPQNILNQVK
jgi:phosphatidylglycerol lysyltransferase